MNLVVSSTDAKTYPFSSFKLFLFNKVPTATLPSLSLKIEFM